MRIDPGKMQRREKGEGAEFFIAASGLPSLRLCRQGRLLHIHSAIKPEDEALYFSDVEFWADLVVLLGTGLGYHLLPHLKKLPEGAALLAVDAQAATVERFMQNAVPFLQDRRIAALSAETPDYRRIVAELSGRAGTGPGREAPGLLSCRPALLR